MKDVSEAVFDISKDMFIVAKFVQGDPILLSKLQDAVRLMKEISIELRDETIQRLNDFNDTGIMPGENHSRKGEFSNKTQEDHR